MKFIKQVAFVAILSCFFVSCGSDELTHLKAKRIIQECLKQVPEQRTVTIDTKSTKLVGEKLEKYQKLQDKGLLELSLSTPKKSKPKPKAPNFNDPLQKWQYEAQLRRYKRELERYKNVYDISITKKAEKYITKASESSGHIKFKTFQYVVDKVLEIIEIPSNSSAKVKVRYMPDDITPFALLSSKDPSEFLIKDIRMIKTSNGWKFCDNY